MTTTAQGWVLLGVLGVLVTAVVTLLVQSQQSLRGYLDARFDAVDVRFDAVGARFDGVDQRIDVLDRDVQALADRVFRRDG